MGVSFSLERENNDKFKSFRERSIAKILNDCNIHFVYEHPLLIREKKSGDSEKLRIWYPDFWLPEYSIVIEYFGKETADYIKGKKAKLRAYKRMNIDCISVGRSTIRGNLKAYLLMTIRRLINEKLRRFENRKRL